MPMPRTFDRIANTLRDQIKAGLLTEGSRLPTVKDLSAQWQSAGETVRHALSQLQAEGLIITTPRGTYVAGAGVTLSGLERYHRAQDLGTTLAEGETARVMAAETVKAPVYVADIFNLEDNQFLIRREYVTGRGNSRTTFSVSWYPLEFSRIPGILGTEPSKAGTILASIDRVPTGGRDEFHARELDAREASALGLKIGSPTLALVSRLWDAGGMIEYTERCLPTRMTVGYDYGI